MVRWIVRLLLGVVLGGCAAEPPPPPPVPAPRPAAFPPVIMSGFGDGHGAGGAARARAHYGIDVRAPIGTPVLAAAAGEVLRVATRPEAGRMVVLRHTGGLATVYMHLDEIWVRPGQRLRRGEPFGRSGMTGNATVPHLHFGVCRHPEGLCGPMGAGWVDPLRYLAEDGACYDAGRRYPAAPLRFTYPIPCTDGPA